MKKLILCACFMFALADCARNPVTGRREIVLVSESQELSMGAQAHQQVEREYGFVADADLQRYVQTIGTKLASVSHRPGLPWHFTVVNSPVINAFAIPGGYIYLTRGILAYLNSEAELAGVVGHEIGHVTARHSVRQITRQQLAQLGLGVGSILSPTFGQLGDLAQSSLGLLFLRFSRDDEREADRLGVEYVSRGTWDPREVSHFFEVLSRLAAVDDRETIPGWLSTHPDPPERVSATRDLAEQWITKLSLTANTMQVNRDAYLRSIDGIIFGDNPREGFTERERFYHPDLAFQIAFPPGWRVENTQSAVLAMDPRQSAQMQLTIAEAPAGTSAEDYVRQLADRGFTPQGTQVTSINGSHAVLALYVLSVEGGSLTALAAFIEHGNRIIQIVGISNNFQSDRDVIEQSVRTFDRITDQRILSVQPDRLRIRPAAEGESIASIAARLKNPRVTADELAILNRMALDQTIAAGRLVKTIEPGM